MLGTNHWILPSKKKKSEVEYNGMLFDFKVNKVSESTEKKTSQGSLSKMHISYILN